MWPTIGLSFLAGLLGANATPHFVKGITRERYPTVFGGSPVVNVVAGWCGLCVAAAALAGAHPARHPLAAGIAVAAGILPMALFHAGVGAFGRTD
jgi:hypothetical protein